MAKRVRISEVNSPSPRAAEAFARLLLEREKDRPVLTLVGDSNPESARYKLTPHDPSSPLSEVV